MKHHTFTLTVRCAKPHGQLRLLSAVVYVWKCNEDSVFILAARPWLQVVFTPGLFTGHFLFDHGVKQVVLCEITGIR